MDGLYYAWCSPNAKDFSSKHFPIISAIDINVRHLGKNIAISATQAYNYIATSNGSSTITDGFFAGDQQAMNETSSYTLLLDKNGDGIVGMNHQNVKLLVSLFKDAVNNLINGLNELPLDIAFYDPNGEMKAAYKKEITDMVNVITEQTTAVYNDIEAALETEIDTILLAKENAASTMTA